LLVEEKAYAVDALKDEEVVKQCKLWHYNKHKKNIPLDEMTLTLVNMTLGFFVNISIPMLNIHPFILTNASIDAHINVNTNPSINFQP